MYFMEDSSKCQHQYKNCSSGKGKDPQDLQVCDCCVLLCKVSGPMGLPTTAEMSKRRGHVGEM